MNKETFGSINKYKMLEFLTEKISLMEVKHKNYLSSVIQDINQTIKKCEMINDIYFRNYILDLIHNDLAIRIENHIKGKYEEKIATYMENYLNAKIINSKQK
jgi:hypothetical protein